MEKLDKNWFVEQMVDFEYKKYILLAYLQNVQSNFGQHRLYPHLSELIWHYKNLEGFKSSTASLKQSFPVELNGINTEKLQLSYRKVISDDSLMQEIEQIVEYSLPRIHYSLKTGNEIREEIASSMSITPIGIEPLYKEEGYLIIQDGPKNDTCVYTYRASLFDGDSRIIHTNRLESFKRSLIHTAEHIKNVLIRRYREKPNPATYYIETNYSYPLQETFMPIASRLLSRYIG